MGVSGYYSNYAQVPSGARLTVCIYIDRLKYWMPYYDVVNLVTVTDEYDKTKSLEVMYEPQL
jgi:hypothetical protein